MDQAGRDDVRVLEVRLATVESEPAVAREVIARPAPTAPATTPKTEG